MTTPLDKPVKREIEILGAVYVVELSRAGVMFRPKGMRRRALVPITEVLAAASRRGWLKPEAMPKPGSRAKRARKWGAP